MIVSMRRVLIAVFAALALAPLAQAATAPRAVFGLRAVGNAKLGYFVDSVAPGGSAHGAVIVTNNGNAAGSVNLYTSDATTGATTGAVYLTDKKPVRAGAWVTLDHKLLTLKPGAHQVVNFTVHVPAGTGAGEWVGGIVASPTKLEQGQKSKQKASVQIKFRNLTIIAVQVNVPGALHAKFTVGAVTPGGSRGFQQVIVGITNTGNVLSKPSGSVTIIGQDGTTLQTIPFQMDTFLPQTTISYPVVLKKALAPGSYTAKVSLSYPGGSGGTGGSKSVTSAPAFTVSKADVAQVFTSQQPTQAPPSTTGSSSSSSSSKTPWLIGAIAAGALVVLAWLLLFMRQLRRARRRRQGPPPAAPVVAAAPPTPEPEPVAPAPPVVAAATATAPPAPEPVAPAAPVATTGEPCDPYHYWDVSYDGGRLGGDGVWRFPHRCRNCGVEVMATDIADATAQAAHSPS
jgi:hypothetical protein